MSCSKNRGDKSKIPKITKKMSESGKIYIWKSLKSNPNINCWIPVSMKTAIPETLSLNDINIQDIPEAPIPENYSEIIAGHAEMAGLEAGRVKLNMYKKGIDKVSHDDPAKYKIVKKFIKDKGLKIYGGVAINGHLPFTDKIYKSSAIPDYDFFSSDPWNDAIELAKKLYDAGYMYTEVRGGIHKGTYKIFSDMWPVADVTYISQDDFKQLSTKTVNGLKIVSAPVLIIDMYRQIMGPDTDITRWLKVSNRQNLLEKWTNPLGRKFKCTKTIFNEGKSIPNMEISLVLEEAYFFTTNKKMLFTGAIAYNTLVEVSGGKDRLIVDSYEVLCEDAKRDSEDFFHELMTIKNLNKDIKFNNKKLHIITDHITWLSINNTSYHVVYKGKTICTFTQMTICTPYTYTLGKNIVSIDTIKYLLYSKTVFMTDKNIVKSIKCQIRYITNLQNNYYKLKNITQFDKSPFQRFGSKCKGDIKDIVKTVILQRWIDGIESRAEIRTVKPTSDTITLKNVKGKTIRIFPRADIPLECNNKNFDECKYPCVWDSQLNKCFGARFGGQKIGVDNIMKIYPEEDELQQYPYPVYG
jgi:hypothetical protein